MMNKKITDEEIKQAASPLIKLLNEKMHPHTTAIVTTASVEILSGEYVIDEIYEFLPDKDGE